MLSDMFYKIKHWEYWNTWLIYLPLAPFWIIHSIRNNTFYFFENTNPSIPFGGMADTSKIHIYNMLPKNLIPKTVFVSKKSDVLESIKENKYSFPLIAKPNIGLKGLGVEIIESENQLLEYQTKYKADFIIQEKIGYQNEIGVFYCRFPNQTNGFITGIVKKNFLKVIGNGKDTLETLVRSDYRTKNQEKRIKGIWKNQWQDIISENEELVLLKIGSHTRGAEFIDYTHILSNKMFEAIDSFASKIDGFYYGRFDIMYENEDLLKEGQNFIIVELNGAMSEPTHMYDPKNNLLTGWKEIIKHWKIMSEIAYQNKEVKVNKSSIREGLGYIIENIILEKELKNKLIQ